MIEFSDGMLHDKETGEKLDSVKLKLARVRFSLDEILATEPDDYLGSESSYQQFQNETFAAIRRAVGLLNGEGER